MASTEHDANPVDNGDEPAVVPAPVEVRRNAGLAALIGGGASAIAIAYLGRATHTGALVDVGLCLVLALIAVVHLVGLVDAKTPLVVADDLGLRIRLGNQWRGLPWEALREVRLEPRRGLLRDGRLVFAPHYAARALEGLDTRGRRHARLNQKLYGAPLAVPIGLTTRLSTDGELLEQLTALARGRTEVTVVAPEPTSPAAQVATGRPGEPVEESAVEGGPDLRDGLDELDQGAAPDGPDGLDPQGEPDQRDGIERPGVPRRSLLGELGTIVSRFTKARAAIPADTDPDPDADEALVADADQSDVCEPDAPRPGPAPVRAAVPLRDPRRGLRAEITRDAPATTLGAAALATDPGTAGRPTLPEGRELRRPGNVDLVLEPVPGDRVRPISTLGEPVPALVIDDFVTEPAYDPVIGPELAAARRRVGLSVDDLAERTRIRPHVIESIEVDDFAPCGGDFYARGHLRTLARVLGRDAVPLLAQFDERYATAPINARRVFEAELATGMTGSMRRTTGGPNWSLLVGVVLSLLLVWGVVRVFVAQPPEQLAPPAPVLNGATGLGRGPLDPVAAPGGPVAVAITATAKTRVVVRGDNGVVVWAGDVLPGKARALHVVPPLQVQARDGAAVNVTVAGERRGPVGAKHAPASRTLRR